MKKQLANYILKLNEAAHSTKRAEERNIYERYLAHAGVMLAMLENGAEKKHLAKEVQSHEKMWGNDWLIDDACKTPGEAWQEVKLLL